MDDLPIGLAADHPAGWLAAMGALACAGPGATISWEVSAGWGAGAATLHHADIDTTAGEAYTRAVQWLASPMAGGKLPVTGATLDEYGAWTAALGRHATESGASWLIDVGSRLLWPPTRDRPGRLGRHAVTYMGSGQATFEAAAAKTAREVTVDALVEALTAPILVPSRTYTTGLRMGGHPGVDWLVVCGLGTLPRHWGPATRHPSIRMPVWSSPLGGTLIHSIIDAVGGSGGHPEDRLVGVDDAGGTGPLALPIEGCMIASIAPASGNDRYRSWASLTWERWPGGNHPRAAVVDGGGRRTLLHPSDLLDAGELADLLSVTSSSLARMRNEPRKYRRLDGMPEPLRRVQDRPVWDAAAVRAWLAR